MPNADRSLEPPSLGRSSNLSASIVGGVLVLAVFVSGCNESTTEPQEEAGITAQMTGERVESFEGDATFSLADDRFVLHGRGSGIYQGHEMTFVATEVGVPEPGTYSVGRLPSGESPEPDLDVSWRMAIAIFSATAGTLTITSITEDEVEGTFEFTATRTQVCDSGGTCHTLSGDQPTGNVGGTFQATRQDM